MFLSLPGALYCEETTLHGLRYLNKPGLCSKLIWLITVFVSFVMAVLAVYFNFMDFLQESNNIDK